MTLHEFAVILQSLLNNQSQTVPSKSIIRDIWVESHNLPTTTYCDNKFLNLGSKLIKEITSLSTQNTSQRAMLYDIAYRVLLSHDTWLDNHPIQHINILSNIVKAWADCDQEPSDNILPTLEKLLEQVDPQKETLSSVDIIMTSYLNQAFLAIKSDLWDTSIIQYNRAIDILNLNSQEQRVSKINYLHNFSLKVALELCIKGYDRVVQWLNRTVHRLKECDTMLQMRLVDTFIMCYRDIKNELSFQELKDSFTILEDIEVRNEPNCCLCFILIISKLSYEEQDYKDKMKEHFMRIAETIRIKEISDLRYFSEAIRAAFNHLSLKIIMEGVDLIIHRYRDQITIGKLSLYKVHLLSKLLLDKYILFDYKNTLKSVMDGIMIDKEDIEPVDLESIQLVCWSTGDYYMKRTKYSEAYDWFNYSLQFFVLYGHNNHNKTILVEKLAICCVDADPALAFEHVSKGLDDKKTALDYLLLIKYCVIKNDDTPMVSQLLDQIVDSEDFKPKLLVDVICYIQKYSGDTSLLLHLLKKVLNLSARNNGQALELVTIHLIVLIIRCLIEATSHSPDKINFSIIGECMKQVCALLCSDDKVEDYTSKDELTLKSDLEWLFKSAWCLCRYFNENHDLYIKFLDVINWVSNLFDKLEYCSVEYSCEYLYIIMYTKMTLFQSLNEDEKEKQGYYCISLDTLKSLKQQNDQMTLQVRFYEIEVLLHKRLFDAVRDSVKEYASTSDCSDELLEKMTNNYQTIFIDMIILDKNCSIPTSLALLKIIRDYYFDKNNVNNYAKWTNVLVSHLENIGELGKIYDIVYEASTVIQAYNEKYPQEELFYLFTIAWNQAVMRFKKEEENPYCELVLVLSNFIQGKDDIVNQVKNQYHKMMSS